MGAPGITSSSAAWSAAALLVSALALGCLAKDGGPDDEPKIEIRCGVDLGLTPESGIIEDWSGAARSWSAAARGDTLTLTRRWSCGDECSIAEELVLAGLERRCPRFVSASSTRSDEGGALGRTTKTIRAEKGILEIESWDPKNGVVSGRIESEVKFTFFAPQAPAR